MPLSTADCCSMTPPSIVPHLLLPLPRLETLFPEALAPLPPRAPIQKSYIITDEVVSYATALVSPSLFLTRTLPLNQNILPKNLSLKHLRKKNHRSTPIYSHSFDSLPAKSSKTIALSHGTTWVLMNSSSYTAPLLLPPLLERLSSAICWSTEGPPQSTCPPNQSPLWHHRQILLSPQLRH